MSATAVNDFYSAQNFEVISSLCTSALPTKTTILGPWYKPSDLYPLMANLVNDHTGVFNCFPSIAKTEYKIRPVNCENVIRTYNNDTDKQ